MSELEKDDYDMLYWHAMTKMRNGQFSDAAAIMDYLYAQTQLFDMGLACAYCFIRNNNLAQAKAVLQQLNQPVSLDAQQAYARLTQRVGL